jgi:hypothetical protein
MGRKLPITEAQKDLLEYLTDGVRALVDKAQLKHKEYEYLENAVSFSSDNFSIQVVIERDEIDFTEAEIQAMKKKSYPELDDDEKMEIQFHLDQDEWYNFPGRPDGSHVWDY